MQPEVLVFARDQDASRTGAEHFAELARRAAAQDGRFNVALSGGDTPREMYRMLAAPPLRDEIPWNDVHLFWGDDRAVPPDHPRSNYRMAHEAFIAHVPVPAGNVHRMRGELPAGPAAAAYGEVLRAHFGEGVPRFDLVHLGVGADGHTASLFPGSPALDVDDRAVVASVDPDRNEPRITLTFPVINAADQVEVLVLDGEAAGVVADLVAGTARARAYPAHRVAPRGRLLWMLGEAAARVLIAHRASPLHPGAGLVPGW